jgi:hypothetical protein
MSTVRPSMLTGDDGARHPDAAGLHELHLNMLGAVVAGAGLPHVADIAATVLGSAVDDRPPPRPGD